MLGSIAYNGRGVGQVAHSQVQHIYPKGVIQVGVKGGGVTRVPPPDDIQYHCCVGSAACKRPHLVL